jgi:TetR/AcrR family transcriptional regulator of autoinduction and epiphytic fitness
VLRGQRNRDAVVDAFLSLLESGEERPTAKRIAARAGVSVRSVFGHFDDLEQIYEIAGRVQVRRLGDALDPGDVALGLPERLEAFVARRRSTLERLDPIARSARLREPFSHQLQANRAQVVTMMRDQCATSFAPEIAEVAGRDVAAADDLVVALATTASWAVWYHLCNDQGLAPADAARTMGAMMRALLTAGPGDRDDADGATESREQPEPAEELLLAVSEGRNPA